MKELLQAQRRNALAQAAAAQQRVEAAEREKRAWLQLAKDSEQLLAGITGAPMR